MMRKLVLQELKSSTLVRANFSYFHPSVNSTVSVCPKKPKDVSSLLDTLGYGKLYMRTLERGSMSYGIALKIGFKQIP